MNVISTNNWKSNIFGQLKEHHRQHNGYDHIVEHCREGFMEIFDAIFLCRIDNRILEGNAILKTQCVKLERDVNQLRLTNAGLERASQARYLTPNEAIRS